MEWDITRYADRLPKAGKVNEDSLRRRYPPLNGITASKPCIVVDMQGIILTWYLPGILSNSRQVGLLALSFFSRKPDTPQKAMLAARETLRPLLSPSQGGNSWRNDRKFFHSGAGPQGSENFSPGWFSQGHDLSALTHRIYLSAAHSKSGNGARISAGFCELEITHCVGMVGCHLRIQRNYKRNPGGNSPQSV